MKKLIYFVVYLVPIMAMGQERYAAILQDIEANNTTLAALREETNAQMLGNRTGITLPDPEAEFNYLWGNPSLIGNRTDFSVTQSFDFPTAYHHRREIAGMQNRNAELRYKAQRIRLLLEAKQTCIELVYQNALVKEYSVRLDHARQIAESYRLRLEQGDANLLGYNKARLNLTAVDAQLAKAEAERERLLSELKRLNGGNEPISLPDHFLPSPLPTDFETWYSEAENRNPLLQYVKGEVNIVRAEVKLNRALLLPKFTTGYMSETVVGEQFRGITLGISLPLWENRSRLREAEARIKSSEAQLEDSRLQFYNQLQGLYRKASILRGHALELRQAVADSRNNGLLNKALESGEISLLEYLLELEYYYDAVEQALEVERDYELALAELSAVEL
ncbi:MULTISPECIES: TolC family protein [Petrimonas]|jgi:cobalt-zinc-cadmium efflux system outer membrane protein|uniref:Outer membrane efflux family protein n=2 Tax=Petrimonas mucosa TaxID=1642646 RepID=A0A1G4G838_9BACT|nr:MULTISPECIES: TolC family protein [Petrimonas]MDD3560399.1 TolC family protein [Petrimonas mucosa]SCM58546.1 Outer membrane efflux family protein {ECO:0000313/EMBL:EXZ05643,1} [Petrimonas mucosa]SFU28594.1 Outer membrane protein TolC [Porphyromonadaceae bacterium KHP3R9]HHT30296.1 TolC family protein [Petrimonas mucosa]